MILLDTHVISEPIKLAGDAKVFAWLDAQMIETLYLSTIILAELRFGIASMPAGNRKDSLQSSRPDSHQPLGLASMRQLPPSFFQPLHTHRLRRPQLLREKAHAQFFQ